MVARWKWVERVIAPSVLPIGKWLSPCTRWSKTHTVITHTLEINISQLHRHIYNGEHHQIDPQLLYVLGIGNHELENPDINIDIEDYIWEENTNKNTTLLFTVQYLDKDSNMAFVLNDTLAPYSIFAPATLESVYGRFDMLYCNFTRTVDCFDIEANTTNPKDKALRGLLDWFDLMYSTIEDFCQKNKRKPFKELMLGVARANIEAIEVYGSFQLGLVEFPRLVYLEYLKLAN